MQCHPEAVTHGTRAGGSDDVPAGHRGVVFFLFSSRLGCLGSLALSALVTVVVLAVFHVL